MVRALILFLAVSSQAGLQDRQRYDWSISGMVVNTQEVPHSGGAWRITVQAEHKEVGGQQYVELWCDHEQRITKKCARLGIGENVRARGYINSNEPRDGQRLSVRVLRKSS